MKHQSNMLLKVTLAAAASLSVLACSAGYAPASNHPASNHPGNATAAIATNVENIKSHMSFLADDLLEGRETGSQGHEIASLYIAGEFAKYGLKPAGDMLPASGALPAEGTILRQH
ncbi:MAG: hypothetical protein ACI8VI_000207 [Granulosicoccus sp.]|jgi:hypothetical protein